MTTHTTTETEVQNSTVPTFYDSMYEYVHDADITHYRKTGDGEEEYQIDAFNPAEDSDFAINTDRTIEHNGKTYIPVCYGEDEPSALLESEIDTAQCYIVYQWNDHAHEYVSDGTVYETREEAELVATVASLTDSQYYDEQCGCERCNAAIGDNQVAGADA